MMKILLSILMFLNFVPQVKPPEVTIDRIEDNIAVVEICYKKKITTADVPTEDFNEQIEEGDKISASVVDGSFEWLDGDDWYQFKSHDNTVWWALTTDDIGFTPKADTTYTLIYYDNGTTDCTECAKEFDCECEVYDDIFLTILK